MDERGWGIVLILGLTAAVVIVVVAVISQIFSLARIKASGEVTADRGATREEQRRVAAELGELQTRVSVMEKRLHEAKYHSTRLTPGLNDRGENTNTTNDSSEVRPRIGGTHGYRCARDPRSSRSPMLDKARDEYGDGFDAGHRRARSATTRP
jgi:hypothetical protein